MSTSRLSTPSPSIYKVAAIQYDPTLGEKEKNVSDLLRLVEEAAQNQARLIVLPEIATTGYCWESRTEIAPYVEPIPGPTTDRFAKLAATYDCYIAVSLPEVDPSTNVYYNSMALIGPTGVIGTYRKIHSYISDPRWARDGDLGMPVWDTPLGRLAGFICMDAMYFESARIPALHDADVLLFPTNWLEEKCPSSWWMARSFENGVYFIAANRYGKERGVQFSGGSCVLNPDGSIQSYLDTGDGIVYGEIDLNRCRQKSWGPPNGEPVGDRLVNRRPEEYTTLVHNTYLWEPLRYHGLYELGELPAGQLSCVAVIQNELQSFQVAHTPNQEAAPRQNVETLQLLLDMIRTLLNDAAPARPDVLVLPELILPGPIAGSEFQGDHSHQGDRKGVRVAPLPYDGSGSYGVAVNVVGEHPYKAGAISIPGPETDALVELATEFQITLVLGVAERVETSAERLTEADKATEPNYYNSVVLIDPEGVYGIYRKLHLTRSDRLWASPGNLGLPTFDTPVGRIGLATGYDILFPETLRVLAGKGADLVCAPTLLNFPDPIGLGPSSISYDFPVAPEGYDPLHYLIWRVRAAEHHVYLAVANWNGQWKSVQANGNSGIFSPTYTAYPWPEVVAEDGEPILTLMTIDTREQRTSRRSGTTPLNYAPGEMAGSLTGELAYDIRDSIPGNVVRSKPLLRKRMPFWYLDLVRTRQ